MTKEEIYTSLLKRTLTTYLTEIRDAESKIQSALSEIKHEIEVDKLRKSASFPAIKQISEFRRYLN